VITPEQQRQIEVTAIVYEMTASDVVAGVHRALDAGASHELILHDYSLNIGHELGHAQCASLCAMLALQLALAQRAQTHSEGAGNG